MFGGKKRQVHGRFSCTPPALTRPFHPLIDTVWLFVRQDFGEAVKLGKSALKGGACTDVDAMSRLAALLGKTGMPEAAIQT